MNYINDFRQDIANRLGSEHSVALFWKGRVALYAILESLGIGSGDEVIIPGLTCVVVPNAIIYTGATPIYADVDPSTYTVTRETLSPMISPRTRAIIVQNTFGLSANLYPILDLANGKGIELIEDCTHGFGGTYSGRPNGSITRISFFSTQWNKPFSTGVGGFAASKDPGVGEVLSDLESSAIEPTFMDARMLQFLSIVRPYLMHRRSYWPMLKLFRWLSARNLVIGSSQAEELKSPRMPVGFLKGLCELQAKIGVHALTDFEETLQLRQQVANEYDRLLSELGKAVPFRPAYAEHTFLKYAVRVEQRELLMKEAEKHCIRLGDWFQSPLHPIIGDLGLWGYQSGSCPRSEHASRELVNLPTDLDSGHMEIERVKNFVRSHAEFFR